MINTVADLLNKLRDIEREKTDAQGITQTTTIGNMYEGITQTLLDQAVFRNLNLNIVRNSFIILKNGKRSDEMDVMLIEGEGKLIINTKEQYDVTFDQVVVVIQSKKKINKQHLEESYHNLKDVYDSAELKSIPDYALRQFRDAYRGTCGEDIFDNRKWRKFFDSSTKEQVFHTLRLEAVLPPRIVLGYDGYTTEEGLRTGFISFLSENVSTEGNIKHGFHPVTFPNLIINGPYSIIKNNGMPYNGKMENNSWPFYCSSNRNPFIHFLEIIWTRLSYKYELDPLIFGEDLEIDESHAFLHANMINVSGRQAWNFTETKIPRNIIKQANFVVDWEPVSITHEQHCILAYLCKEGKLLITKISPLLNRFGLSGSPDLMVKEQLDTGLVYLDGHKHLMLLTDRCQCVMIKEGIFAADNKSGRLTRWVEKKTGKKIKNILDLR